MSKQAARRARASLFRSFTGFKHEHLLYRRLGLGRQTLTPPPPPPPPPPTPLRRDLRKAGVGLRAIRSCSSRCPAPAFRWCRARCTLVGRRQGKEPSRRLERIVVCRGRKCAALLLKCVTAQHPRASTSISISGEGLGHGYVYSSKSASTSRIGTEFTVDEPHVPIFSRAGLGCGWDAS